MADTSRALRHLPSVDKLVDALAAHLARSTGEAPIPRALLVEFARAELQEARRRVGDAGPGAGDERERALLAWIEAGGPLAGALARLTRERGAGLLRAINVSGVVLNTGLGRAPWHPEAVRAAAEVAGGYAVVEVDRWSGERNQRDERVSELLTRLLPCEAALAVNNCAAAVLLALQSLSGGRETLVSRGELVEIGGSFRMPAVMERAGVQLVEVGTTNRTRIGDFEAALGPKSALLLKVHPSNFRIRGFAEEASPKEMAELARQHGLFSAYDLGSGRVDVEGAASLDFLGDEPDLHGALQSGVDVVMFSGDKLLGGPQAGLVVGRAEVVAKLRKNPLYRALRLDKTILAGLERTLELLLAGRADELPARALLQRAAAEIEALARRIAEALSRVPGLEALVLPERSQPGSGSAPDVYLDTFVVALAAQGRSPSRLAAELRALPTPVFARVHEGRVLLDPRTLLAGEEEQLLELLRAHPWTGTGPRP
ncbi:MAG: L-seryl-tRNA(Sec) selenium transferase [Planctomycetaceae bacterium]|nr:L-seryl-tRNA(Sec) selenium transferase [Planctomycetaceae bacterium]